MTCVSVTVWILAEWGLRCYGFGRSNFDSYFAFILSKPSAHGPVVENTSNCLPKRMYPFGS